MTRAFDQVLGSARGLDIAGLRERVDALERRGAELASELRAADAREHDARRGISRLQAQLAASLGLQDQQTAQLQEAQRAAAVMRVHRDQARARLIRSGGHDEPHGRIEDHGAWSARRAYLAAQRVEHDGSTWITWTGAAPSVRPGASRRWARVPEGEAVKLFAPSARDRLLVRAAREPLDSPEEPGPHFAHRLLFQGRHWWDRHRQRWSVTKLVELQLDQLADGWPPPLSDAHLAGVVGFLCARATRLFADDLAHQMTTGEASLIPCPPYAYRSADEWLADLPLMRALRDERRLRARTR